MPSVSLLLGLIVSVFLRRSFFPKAPRRPLRLFIRALLARIREELAGPSPPRRRVLALGATDGASHETPRAFAVNLGRAAELGAS